MMTMFRKLFWLSFGAAGARAFCDKALSAPNNFSRGSFDHLTALNKVLNLRVTHFLSDDADDRAYRRRLERMI